MTVRVLYGPALGNGGKMYPERETIKDIIDDMENLDTAQKLVISKAISQIEERQKQLFRGLEEELRSEMGSGGRHGEDGGGSPGSIGGTGGGSAGSGSRIAVLLIENEFLRDIREYGFFEMSEGYGKAGLAEDPFENGLKDAAGADGGIQGPSFYYVPAFWMGSYSELAALTDKNRKYEGELVFGNSGRRQRVPFFIERVPVLVKQERKLFRLAKQYGIYKPLIYNPMARRAIELKFELPSGTDPAALKQIPGQRGVDFRFEENGIPENISRNILMNMSLAWNMESRDMNLLPPCERGMEALEDIGELPYMDDTFTVYRQHIETGDDGKTEYILPDSRNGWAKRVRDLIYWQSYDDRARLRYEKLIVHHVKRELKELLDRLRSPHGMFFRAGSNPPALGIRSRVRTTADAVRLVNMLSDGLGICCGRVYKNIEAAKRDNRCDIIYTYEKGYEYYPREKDCLRGQTAIAISFAPGKPRDSTEYPGYLSRGQDMAEDPFMVDKVSYVMEYLNHCYPEYHWVGVK